MLNVCPPPVFQVGYAVKRTGNPIVLLTITTFYLGGPIYFGIGQGVIVVVECERRGMQVFYRLRQW